MKCNPRHALCVALWVASLFSLISCTQGQSQVLPPATAVAQQSATPQPSTTPSPPSTETATPQPSATPTHTTTATPTLTITYTPTPLNPLMIEVMRQQSYPGSEITFEQILEPTDAYERYIVSYQSEGNKIYAYLTKPLGPRPPTGFPLIIFNHGYIPPSEYRTTERYVNYVDALARNGYMVFRSDYRGHGESEGEATGGYGTPDYTIDVLNGMAAAKTLPSADPNRIGFWGHSMGGHITLRAMVVSDEIDAGVIWGGVVVSYADLFNRWRRGGNNGDTPDPTREARRRQGIFGRYGSPEENPEFWQAVSPNSFLTDLSGPIQLHHGTADSSVPYEFSEILEAEIKAVGGEVELYLYEGDNHNISYSFDEAMARTIAFFDLHVKGATP